MAQRAATFARRPSGGTRAAERARSMAEPAGAPVTLDLQSLLAPYKRHRGLSIRVERLLHGARLTQGRNNGDRSWSLLPDDLEDLDYLPATAAYEAHTLAVRIISVDGGDGETLAVLDLPIAGVAPVETPKPDTSSGDTGANNEEVAKLREELAGAAASLASREAELSRTASALAARDAELSRATSSLAERETALTKATSSLAARDVELSVARKRAEDAEKLRGTPQADLAAARQAWERELQNRLSAAAQESKAAMDKARAEWQADNGSQAVRAEAGASRALEDVRRRAREELDASLSKARSDWKAAEAARFSAAEAVWREEASKTATDLRARAEAAEKALAEATTTLSQTRGMEADEARRLRDQLAQAQSQLATRGAELAEARATVQLARKAGQDATTELRKAEEARKTAEAARIASVEARWKDESNKVAGELTSRLDQTEKTLAETRAQAEARLHQLGIAQAALKARETELEQLRATAEQTRLQLSGEAQTAREAWKHELETALAKAQDEWKAAEAARLAAAEAQWNAQLATATAGNTVEVQELQGSLLQTQVELQTLRDSSHKDLRKLRDELAAAQISLSARETELASARAAAEQARANADSSSDAIVAKVEKARVQWQHEADEALTEAKSVWLAQEDTRISAAVAEKLQAMPAEGLKELSEKLQQTETALADAQSCTDALRRELAAAQNSLSHRELELAEARAMIEQEHDRIKHAPISTTERRPRWEVDEEERRAQFRKRLIRDLAIVSCLAGLGFIAYPRVQPVVADAFPQSSSLNYKLQPLLQMTGLWKPVASPSTSAVEPHAIVDVRIANLRAQPSTGAAVVTKLARNMEVTTVERRGDWVFVRVGQGANQQQGWIASSVLKNTDTAGATAAE